MKLSEIKESLNQMEHIQFFLPSGELVPSHFHVTEIGSVQKSFIDCGGTLRKESVINFQLFTANDFEHRLSAHKLQSIIELSEKELALKDEEIEVEYQGDTIGKYGLELIQGAFHLINTQTDCLAKDNCGIPQEKPKIRISTRQTMENSCVPGSGCC
ncbi:MAG: hypothetical protein JXR07_16580 [Reichenbachiella sp.]